MISLDNRLKACAGFVTAGGICVDVGTDHGYLASYLVINGICKSAIACDINNGPLNTARQTVEKLGLKGKIDLILSDGLDNIPDEEITDVIIAGMGGELIAKIISKANWLQRGTNLVLQPMTKAEFLREWLFCNGFKILNEKPVCDGIFNYTIIQAAFSGEFKTIDDYFAYTGLIDSNSDEGKLYFKAILNRIEKIISGLKKSEDKFDDIQKYCIIKDKIIVALGD